MSAHHRTRSRRAAALGCACSAVLVGVLAPEVAALPADPTATAESRIVAVAERNPAGGPPEAPPVDTAPPESERHRNEAGAGLFEQIVTVGALATSALGVAAAFALRSGRAR
ncbi:hypothetical protein [Saccharopolyspora sp. CA-218241]|uniref:hypothetical protein n=1 Tax=Saccharopolyspora sp. CA-218241 TaxID=3240027 RepID=UPI003D999FC5